MTENTLRVIAHLVAKPGKEDELGEVLKGLIEPTRAEEKNLSYVLWQSRDNRGQYTFVEEWVDETALAAHFETDHILSALGKIPELLQEEMDLRKYSVVG